MRAVTTLSIVLALDLILAVAVTAVTVVAGGPNLDPNLPGYEKVEGLRGTLNAATAAEQRRQLEQ